MSYFIKYCLVIIIFGTLNSQLGAYSYWQLKDGTGSQTVKDSGSNRFDGRIVDPERCVWSREDDRGFFLNFDNGGAIRAPNRMVLILEKGIVFEIHFSCDINAIGESGFASIFSIGDDGASGYNFMVGKQGELLLKIRHVSPGQKIIPLGLKSGVDYRLQITVGENKVKVKLNGEDAAEYTYQGKIGVLGKEFFIGSIPKHPFTGNIYEVKMTAYGEKVDWQRHVMADFKPIPIHDPQGTVVLADFTRFSPRELIRTGIRPAVHSWMIREVKFFKGCEMMIYPPADTSAGEISIDPEMQGKYDVYLALRCINDDTHVQMRIGEQPEYATITASGVGAKHRNVEILVQRNVEMSGTRLYLSSTGSGAYVGYIKLIPSANRRENEVFDPAGKVVRGSRFTPEDADKLFQKQIDEKITSGFFVERVYVEEKTAANPSAESGKRGYQLFNRNWMDLLFRVSVPQTDTGGISLKAAATPGEFEPVSFGVRGLRDIPRLTLKQSEAFRNAAGMTIPVNVDIGVVEAIAKRTTNYTGRSEFMIAPQYIENSDTLALKPGESRQFWITLQPPQDAPAGVFRAVFELSDGTNTEKIPLELEVYPFKLDKLTNMDIGMWPGDDYTRQEIERSVTDMAAHGCTSLICRSATTLAFKGETAETFTVDWQNSTLPFFMNSFLTHGMSGRVHFLMHGAYETVDKRFPRQWKEVYSKILKDIETKRKNEGWPEFVYWSFDEVLSNPSLIPAFKRDVKLQKELGLTSANNHIWYKTARPYQKDCDEIAPSIDIFVNRFNTRNFWYVDTWAEMMRRCRELGKELIPYNSNNAIVFAQPAAARYSFGWFARTAGLGITGHLIYTYNLTFNNPYNDLDSPWTDWVYQYPPFGNRKGGPALDWESYREGVDDLRYIVTLENLIAEAAKKNVDASDAKQLLASLVASFDMDRFYKESRFIDPKWDRTWEEAGKRFASGRFNVPNGWKLEDYDQARRKIADKIIKLQAKMK